jgi:hypothetical protein
MLGSIFQKLCETPPDRGERYNAIVKLLIEHDVPYTVQEFEHNGGKGTNIIIDFHRGNHTNSYVFEAHYDTDPHTVQGANDNTMAVAILITLATELKNAKNSYPVTILLSDLEEPGNGGFASGAKAFADFLTVLPDFVLCLDVVGKGDFLCCDYEQGGYQRLEGMLRAISSPVPYAAVRTPPGSNVGFREIISEDRVALVCTLPGDEVVRYHAPPTWRVLHTPDDTADRCTDQWWLYDLLVRLARWLGEYR